MSDSKAVLRAIRPEDNPYLEHIIKSIFHEFEMPLTKSTYEDEDTHNMYSGYNKERTFYFVLEKDGEVIGGAGLKHLPKADQEVCELQKMYILKPFRGDGYGRLLMDSCLEKAREMGFRKMYLESASQLKSAIAMYERYGFRYLDRPMGETGHTACGVWMLKDL